MTVASGAILTRFEPNLRSTNPMGSVESRVEMNMFWARTALTIIAVGFSHHRWIRGLAVVVLPAIITVKLATKLPYFQPWVNKLVS